MNTVPCRFCGQQSRTQDACEWCHKPLAATNASQPAPPGGPIQPAQTARQVRVALTGKALEEPTARPPSAPARNIRVALTGEVVEEAPTAPPAAYGVARMPTPSGPGLAPGALPNAAIAPVIMQNVATEGAIPLGERWEKCLAFGLPAIVGAMAILHAAPHTYLWLAPLVLMLLGLIMGATGAIPSYDDAVTDCAVVLVLAFLMGPFLALVIYLVVGAIKQECNAALVALLAANILVPIPLRLSAFADLGLYSLLALFGLFSLTGFVSTFFSFGGWLISNFLRPVNE